MAFNVAALFGTIRIEGLAEAERGLGAVDRGFTAAGESASRAGARVDQSSTAFTANSRAANTATSSSARYRAAQLSAVAATERYNALLSEENVSLGRLASAEAAVIRANERVSASTPVRPMQATAAAARATAEEVSGARTRMVQMLETAGKLGLLVGGFEIARKAIEYTFGAGRELTSALNSIQAAARATNPQMAAVRAEAIALGKDLRVPGATAVDAANAIEDLVKAGVSLPRAMQAARAALLLAGAATVDTADSARVLGDVLDEFKLKASEATHVAGILAAAANLSAGGLMSVFQAFTYVGTRARSLGMGVADIAASIVDLSKAGISADRAGTGMAMMLQKLSHESNAGQQALDDLGVSAWNSQHRFVGLPRVIEQLHTAQQRFGTGSQRFVSDISIAFGARAANVVAAFALKGVDSYNRFLAILKTGNVQHFADLMNRGVSAGFSQLNKEFTAAGIDLYQKFEPAITKAVWWVGTSLPHAVSTAGSILGPFASFVGGGLADAWHVFGGAMHYAGDVLGPVLHLIDDLKTPLGATAAAVLGVWAAFKSFQIAAFAVNQIRNGFVTVAASARGAVTFAGQYASAWGGALAGAGTASAREAAQLEADMAAIGRAAAIEAAEIDAAKADEMEAYAALVAASDDATATQVANAQNVAAAARQQATVSAEAAAATAEAADAASASVVAAGDAAEIGWTGVLGPLAAVGIGVGLLVSMFHKSDDASKAAAAAARAYTDALKSSSGAGPGDDVIGTIVSRMSDANVPQQIEALNKAMQSSVVSGKQFIAGVQGQGSAYESMRSRLQGIITSSQQALATVEAATSRSSNQAADRTAATLTAKINNARGLLNTLNAEHKGLFEAQAKEIAAFKTVGTVASSMDKVAQSTRLSTDQAKQYAAMLGYVADSNGVVAASSKDVRAAINTVAQAYRTASGSGQEFLAALEQFSKSGATSADRAALIGATLKAANGDALAYAAAMNAASGADDQLASGLKQAASQVGKHGETVRALTASIVNLKTGTIDYNKSAAAPMISGLQSMQTAAMAAAQAQYQHEVATKGGRQAAQDAYNTYVSQTRGSLIDEAGRLGLTKDQAKKLADQYFGMPKQVKTLIKAEGVESLKNVLDRLGKQLSYLTGRPWLIRIDRNIATTTTGGGASGPMIGIPQAVGTAAAFGRKTIPPNTAFTVGEAGWEGGVTDSQGRASIFSNAQSKAMGFAAPKRYATGTGLMGYVTGAGFRGQNAQIMDAIAQAESGGDAHAHNYNPATQDDSWGLTQLNLFGALRAPRMRAWGITDPHQLWNPALNLRIAHQMFLARGGFGDWSTYNSGAYRQFLGSDGTLTNGGTGAGGAGGGSPVVPVKVHGGWQVGDTVYASKRAAENAARRANSQSTQQRRQQQRQQLTAGRHAVNAGNKLGNMLGRDLHVDKNGNLHGSTVSVGDIRSQLGALGKDLRDAGASKTFIDRIKNEGTAILAAARSRNRAAAEMQRAHAALVAARNKQHQDMVSFRSTARGVFDVASAGTDPVTGKVTKGSMLAQQRQAITRLRAWFSGLHKVAHLIPAGYFRQLESQGPDALPQLQAILSMNPGQLRTFSKQAGEIADLTNRGAQFGSSVLDHHAVAVARQNEREWARRERRREHHLEQLFGELRGDLAGLKIAGKAEIDLKKGQLVFALERDQHHVATHRRGRPKASG